MIAPASDQTGREPSREPATDSEAPQFVPAAPRNGQSLSFLVDGRRVTAHAGESLLSAILQQGCKLRHSEFTGEPRAGFCLMNACQDCWIWTLQGSRLRACTTPASEGLELCTQAPAGPMGARAVQEK